MRQIRVKKSPAIKNSCGQSIDLCVTAKTAIAQPLYSLSLPFKVEGIGDNVVVMPQVTEKLAQHGYFVTRCSREADCISIYLGCVYGGTQMAELTLKKGEPVVTLNLIDGLRYSVVKENKNSDVKVI